MAAAYDQIDEHRLASDLAAASHRPWQIKYVPVVDSTMELAKTMIAAAGEETPALLALAGAQLRGRGRQGRTWISQHKGYYSTYAFHCPQELSTLQGFSLAVGVSVAETLEALGCEVALKWPNDVLLPDSRKLSGVLIETCMHNGVLWILIGIGINVGIFETPVDRGASLAEILMRDIEISEIATMFSPHLHANFQTFLARGLPAFRDAWLARCAHKGKRLIVDLGESCAEGEMVDLSDQGGMILRSPDGSTREITAGSIVKDPNET